MYSLFSHEGDVVFLCVGSGIAICCASEVLKAAAPVESITPNAFHIDRHFNAGKFTAIGKCMHLDAQQAIGELNTGKATALEKRTDPNTCHSFGNSNVCKIATSRENSRCEALYFCGYLNTGKFAAVSKCPISDRCHSLGKLDTHKIAAA